MHLTIYIYIYIICCSSDSAKNYGGPFATQTFSGDPGFPTSKASSRQITNHDLDENSVQYTPDLTWKPGEGDALVRNTPRQNEDPLDIWENTEGTGEHTIISGVDQSSGRGEQAGLNPIDKSKLASEIVAHHLNPANLETGDTQLASNAEQVSNDIKKNTHIDTPLDIEHLQTVLENNKYDEDDTRSWCAVEANRYTLLSPVSEDDYSDDIADSRITKDTQTSESSNSSLDLDGSGLEEDEGYASSFLNNEDDEGDDWTPLVLTVKAPDLFKGEITLVLSPVEEFLSPGFVIQRVNGNMTWLEEGQTKALDCYYTGRVLEAPRESNVAVSVCNGVMIKSYDYSGTFVSSSATTGYHISTSANSCWRGFDFLVSLRIRSAQVN
ncbi:hypothetical protein ElyMa_004383200 [Elysia marginata]|uniref:Peptidase M12B propeptide domain-containing protein n=1 Tax=Elysia marginata TaxID=1093978 RepID=A0AAV4HA39_9GAST|nr:hypothetical protein ElyMa_004383200 [Elysia marginata]